MYKINTLISISCQLLYLKCYLGYLFLLKMHLYILLNKTTYYKQKVTIMITMVITLKQPLSFIIQPNLIINVYQKQ